MDEIKLRMIIADQRESFLKSKSLIDRDINIDYYIKTKQIVIISGIRRSGKSSLLYLIHKKLNKKFLYFNFDDERLFNFSIEDFNKIYEIFLSENEDEDAVFYFDEIQIMNGWEKFLNRMHEKGIKIFVTGSNAKLLSSEIATSLTGRNVVINLMPFSLKEFLCLKNVKIEMDSTSKIVKLKKLFKKYFEMGGFPLVIEEDDLELIKVYYNDIFYRDIVSRYKINNIDEIKNLSTFLMSNSGKIISYSKLGSLSNISSSSLVKKYLGFFFDSYLFFELKKYDVSVKKQILNPRKIYSGDLAFARKIGFHTSNDDGRFLENLVFLELKRRNKEVFYHLKKKECDFVIFDKNKISQAIQVTWLLNEINKEREFEGLYDAMDQYGLNEGLILTYSQEEEKKYKGKKIIIKPVWKWLLE